MARTDPQVNLRLPSELKEHLAELAEREGRSLNSLIVELLSEKMEGIGAVQAMAEGNLLATAYFSAQAAELYAQAARGAILRYCNDETPADDIPPFLSSAPPEKTGTPLDLLTPLQRDLIDEVSALDADEQAAILTLIGKRKK